MLRELLFYETGVHVWGLPYITVPQRGTPKRLLRTNVMKGDPRRDPPNFCKGRDPKKDLPGQGFAEGRDPDVALRRPTAYQASCDTHDVLSAVALLLPEHAFGNALSHYDYDGDAH